MAERQVRQRTWTWTTTVKLEVLEKYLSLFTGVSGRAPASVYLDLFAGGAFNARRDTGELMRGSARLALDASPPFSVVRCIELGPKAAQLREVLQTDYPGRD